MALTSPKNDPASRYPGQPHDEITERVVYKHIMAIAPILVALVVIIVLFLIGSAVALGYQQEVNKYVSPLVITLIGFGLLVMLIFMALGTIWIWRRNKVIITNQHIVDVDQIGLFNRKVSTLRLEEIQDISSYVNGPLQTLLQYGTILVQTAGEVENFVFDYVPNPYELEHYILETRKKYYQPDPDDDEGVKASDVPREQPLDESSSNKTAGSQDQPAQAITATKPAATIGTSDQEQAAPEPNLTQEPQVKPGPTPMIEDNEFKLPPDYKSPNQTKE